MNGGSFLKLLQDKVRSLFWSSATRGTLWWMQDGAPPHYTNMTVNPEIKVLIKGNQQLEELSLSDQRTA